MNNRKYYKNIDIVRFIASFFIIAIHTSFLKNVSAAGYFCVMSAAGLAVPIFFAASGFFLFSKFSYKDGKIEKTAENTKIMLSYEKRLIITYLVWSAVYFVIRLFTALRKSEPIKIFFITFIKDFFLNGSQYHLWYVTCLIYAVVLLFFLLRRVNVKHFVWILPVLYVIGQLVEGYSWLDLPFINAMVSVKNVLGYVFQVPFRAVTFAGAGIYLSQKELRLSKIPSAVLAVLFFLSGCAEVYTVSKNFAPGINIRYTMFSYLTVFFLMNCFIKTASDSDRNIKVCSFLRKTSSFIYFVHPAILFVLQSVFPSVRQSDFVYYIVACILSFAVSAAVVRLSDKIKILKYTF